MSTAVLVSHNVAFLQQALDLLERLDDAAYAECRPPYFSSSIGDHLRHIVEHYQCFVSGLPGGSVDYDGRQRDARIAGRREHAAGAIEDLIMAMETVRGADGHLRVRLDGSSDVGDEDPWSESTVKRELQYLQAHTVHHYALIAFIMRLQGTQPDESFGVAPSTLRFRSQEQTLAGK